MNSKRATWKLSEDKSTYVLTGLPSGYHGEVVQQGDKWLGSLTTPVRSYLFDHALALATAKSEVVKNVRFFVSISTMQVDASKINVNWVNE